VRFIEASQVLSICIYLPIGSLVDVTIDDVTTSDTLDNDVKRNQRPGCRFIHRPFDLVKFRAHHVYGP